MGNIKDALPWYADGLRFECQPNCGRCCHTGEVGPTLLGSDGEHDAEKLAKFFGWPLAQFIAEGTVASPYRYPNELGQVRCLPVINGTCVFLGDDDEGVAARKCLVYESRPRQCRAYPWFDSHLATPETWAKAGLLCPGIGKCRVWSFEEIEAARATVHWEFEAFTLGM